MAAQHVVLVRRRALDEVESFVQREDARL